ncbi:CvfB family protein [Bacillus marinisedimentorum]|uniref:CvfB family protein n=1 Tax=Bacillus marinisedimentorum TaxID=1821260 RepID=UPI0008729904|nr:S1-like domain-containing RNA-binding protein [Bacillus marinisedimentorum]
MDANQLEAGTVVSLKVEREAPYGYFLTNGEEDVLLHESQMEEELELGDEVEVFLYQDKQYRLSATMTLPAVRQGVYGWADVVEVKPRLGAFVDIGISKDILVSLDDLPAIMELWPEPEDRLFVTLKTDKKGRLFAAPATEGVIEDMIVPAGEELYNKNILGRVYRLLKVGSFLITEEGYRCFVHETEREQEPRLGQLVEVRVIEVKEDGTLNASMLPRKQDKMGNDAEAILAYMETRNGAMPYWDKSYPEDIKERFGMSKAAFKRALGKLMKEDMVYQEEGWTYRKKE